MYWFLLQHGSAEAAPTEAGAATGQHAEQAAHHTPIIVDFVNRYLGEPLHHLQMEYTKPLWDRFFDWVSPGTTAEDVFGAYTAENAVPWWTIMFVIASVLSFVVILILKGMVLSSDEPGDGLQVLEVLEISGSA